MKVVPLGMHLGLEPELAQLAGWLPEGGGRLHSGGMGGRLGTRARLLFEEVLIGRARGQGDALSLKHRLQGELAVQVHQVAVQVSGLGKPL